MLITEDKIDAWQQFLQFAEDKCSSTAYENWLAPIKVLQVSNESVTLEVPNIFVKEYLLENYQKDLAAFLPLTASGEPAIEFIIAAVKKEQTTIILDEPQVQVNTQSNAQLKLNQNYLFDNFIEGPTNQFVKSAAIGIAARPGKTYNPLFIHGKVGLGKTHILHAIGHSIKKSHKNMRIQCITTESFINDLVDSLRNKSVAQMKKFYRHLDVLLVDDIQFLQNRLNFEEEFCNMFEALINQNKQIVITCDKPPTHLKLSERMTARMEWGLVAQLTSPDLETRVAIIQHKAEMRGLKVPQEIAFYIAERVSQNVRQLEGAVNKLSAYCHVLDTALTENMVVDVLGEMLRHAPSKKISIDAIFKSVSQVFTVKISDLKTSTRTKEIVIPRQIAMYLAKELVGDSLTTIGSAFGKTHSTILHAVKNIETKIRKDPLLARQIDLVRKGIEQYS